MKLAGTLIAAIATAATFLPAAAAQAAYPGANGRIAYERQVAGGHRPSAEIFVTGPGGREVARIAASRGGDLPTAPAFSADGSKLVFERESPLGFGSIVVANADGSGEHLVPGEGHRPSLSPDGRRLALDSGSSVWVERLNGSGRTRLAPGEDPAWSPDGRRIAFVSGGDVYVARADGSSARRLTRDGGNYGPDWSPAGKALTFWHTRSANTIEVVGANGRGRTSLGAGMQPAWSPDGSRIAFTCPRGVCTMRPDGSGRRLSIAGGFMPAWQPARSP
jgi:Tol biopolymer transport system component